MTMEYESQSARDAQSSGYGDKVYWDYLDQHAKELRDYYLQHGDTETAQKMMIRDLGEVLRGNEGI